VPTERSSAERPVHPGPAASLVALLGLRARGLSTGARIAVVVGVALLVAMTVVSVTFPSEVGLVSDLTDAMRRYLPVGYLAFVVTTATAVLFGGGGREALPADQVVAFPVGPTTDHLAGLVLAPLNLAWLLQAWTLLASVAVLTHGGHTWAAVVPVVLWLVAVTVLVQWLSWVVEYVRRGPRGELLVRTAAVVVGLVIVAVISTGHLLDAVLLTPAAWASSLPYLGAEGDWLNWLFGCLLLVAASLGAAILGSSAAKLTWTRPATTQARVETRRYASRPFPRSNLRALVAIDRGSVWRSAPLRRGLVLLSLLPVVVAFAGRLDWLMVPVLPGLVASGGALLFGVNAWALDARGAVWRESLPVPPVTSLVARAWVLVEVLMTASVATLVICGWRAGPPTSAELSAAVCATATIALRTVASGLRWSVRRPFSVDLRSVRATPAPPLVMVAYSARLAVAATLTGLVFSVVGRLFSLWVSVGVAVLLCATSVVSLWWTARLWSRADVRSNVVETVATV
jgi:hypothetical protein